MSDSDGYLLEEINKRLTLNLLIQGSAQHACLTSHYLVRDELNAINPGLLRLYDQFSLAIVVQHWCGDLVLVCGRPDRFWRRTSQPDHPFCRHDFLSRYGLQLASAAKDRAYERCRVKRVSHTPVIANLQQTKLLFQILWKEARHKAALVDLAKQATHRMWGIPCERLDGQLTTSVGFGRLSTPPTFRGKLLRGAVAGYGGVLSEGSELRVVGKAWTWPLLSHELAKGTAELICMHGLNQMDATMYEGVLKAADRLEYEPWMLQIGPEFWRQFLPLLPDGQPVAEILMDMARLPARELECLMFAVIEDKDWARELLAGLGQGDD